MTQTIKLYSGAEIPSIGLGLWKVDSDIAPDLIEQAVACGYRHFDGACDYGNEAAVGTGLRRVLDSGAIAREDLWVTSKLWNTYHRSEHVRGACERSLRDYQIDYLDLYLIHFPISQRYINPEVRYPPGWFYDPKDAHPRMELDAVPIIETWLAMEELVREGLVRHIGVSNFGCSLIRDLLAQATIRPSILQVESHPYLTQEKLLRYCQDEQIVYTAFSPFGAPSYIPLGMAKSEDNALEHPLIIELARKYGRTTAQILLRWGVQRGTAVIPKSSQVQRLRENLAIFDFTLNDEDMRSIGSLNRGQRFNDPGVFCETAFGTFCPIYE
jgi:D-xylose reductase